MRKYLRVTIVLMLFTVVVLFRQTQESDGETRLLSSEILTISTPRPVSSPTPTPLAATTTASVEPSPPSPTPSRTPPSQTPTVVPEETTGIKIGSVPRFADGIFTGQAVRTNYGPLKLSIEMDGGRLESIRIVQYPGRTPTSIEISEELLPELVERAVGEQEWRVDAKSGATQTSKGFQKALVYALRAAAAP